jgi:hypothetical protein
MHSDSNPAARMSEVTGEMWSLLVGFLGPDPVFPFAGSVKRRPSTCNPAAAADQRRD